MILLAIILFGMVIGAAAQWILGRTRRAGVDWALALAAGLIGSFVGGLLAGLIAGDGLELQPSGVIGSIVGAIIVTAGWYWYQGRRAPAPAATAKGARRR